MFRRHKLDITNELLANILAELCKLNSRMEVSQVTLDQLQAQVAQNTSVEQSAITLIQGLAAQLSAAASDPAKVQALADQLNSSATALASAVTANTPASPAA